jgi:ABC-type phosphate transport system substrate-binding protein
MRSTLRRGAVVALGAAAALSLGLGSATADPNYFDNGTANPAGFLPDSNDLVGVGSDTTQFVTNAFANGYNGAGDVRIASFDAINPVTGSGGGSITIRDTNQDTPLDGSGTPDQVDDDTVVPRPNGSSAGINALINNTQFNFARSSRPGNGSTNENNLKFIPFASDGLSYIIDDGVSFVPTNLTAANLRDIYTCQLPGYNAKLPQAGSGTRAFFLAQIQVTEAQITQAVADGCVDASVQEHAASAVDGDPFALAPFSTARWEANPADPNNPPSNVTTLASTVDPGAFSVARDVYHVVRLADWTGPESAKFTDVFGPTGHVCTMMADGEQGFTSIGARCGS